MNLPRDTHRRTHFAPNTRNSLGANPTWSGIRILGRGGRIWLAACNALLWLVGSGVGIDPRSVWQEVTAGVAVTVRTKVIMGRSATIRR
jgi:hypothetical protein